MYVRFSFLLFVEIVFTFTKNSERSAWIYLKKYNETVICFLKKLLVQMK